MQRKPQWASRQTINKPRTAKQEWAKVRENINKPRRKPRTAKREWAAGKQGQ